MPSSRSDYILRLIEELGAVLRRLRQRLAGGPADAQEVRDEAARAQAELLGPLWPTLRLVDAETAARLVGDPRRLGLWVELVRVEADAARLLDDDERADALLARASALERAGAERPGDA